jgi:hypothetical protein
MTAPATEPTTEVVLPLVTDDIDYQVVIQIRGYRKADIATGKYVVEQVDHTIQTTYTKSELNTLLFQLQPISPA